MRRKVDFAWESRFWNIVMLKEKLNTLAIVDNQLKTIEQNVNAAVNAGVANRNDLLQVNLKRNELKSSRIHGREQHHHLPQYAVAKHGT